MYKHATGFIGIDASVFYTYFTNKIVADFITDPQKIFYDNLNGHAISKGITLNTDFAFTNNLKIMLGATLMDVYQIENHANEEIKLPQLFAPRLSGTYAVSYTIDKLGLTLDLTGRINGPMHLPLAANDHRPAKSPLYTLANIQLSKSINSGWEFYAGIKNILNFVPDEPLLNPQAPFSEGFDTSYNYAPVQGIKGFIGTRFTFN
jgi:outer membrane receptor for ferrienterochelin and colicins